MDLPECATTKKQLHGPFLAVDGYNCGFHAVNCQRACCNKQDFFPQWITADLLSAQVTANLQIFDREYPHNSRTLGQYEALLFQGGDYGLIRFYRLNNILENEFKRTGKKLRLLDAGCGVGSAFSEMLLLDTVNREESWGITLTPSSIINQNVADRIISADIMQLDILPEDRFDVVVSVEGTLHYDPLNKLTTVDKNQVVMRSIGERLLPPEYQLYGALRTLKFLKPGGLLISRNIHTTTAQMLKEFIQPEGNYPNRSSGFHPVHRLIRELQPDDFERFRPLNGLKHTTNENSSKTDF